MFGASIGSQTRGPWRQMKMYSELFCVCIPIDDMLKVWLTSLTKLNSIEEQKLVHMLTTIDSEVVNFFYVAQIKGSLTLEQLSSDE